MDVRNWLKSLELEQYEAAFIANDVDAKLLPTLTAEELKDIGVHSIRHRRRLMEAILALRSEITSASANPDERTDMFETAAERRPLSVMFCDLIGSTPLSVQLDPEDLREVIRSYQACVAATIQPFNGFIAQYLGDGVLIYFGWPEAHETDAEMLQVRVGIATGLVVIGEPVGLGDSRQQAAIGETPNRAARLQGLAAPNRVMIDEATHRQIGRLFDCQELGRIELKGLPEAVPVWQVITENRAVGQFEALRPGRPPLVGRQEEVELLVRRWTHVKSGSGKVVLISAEPGIGKSRIAEALTEQIAAEPHVRLRYFCSPHQQDTALYPVITQMERAAAFAHDDTSEDRLAKLQKLLAATEPSPEDMELLGKLHGLSFSDLKSPLDLTPQQRKEKTFEALVRQAEALTRRQPVLMVFDDLHWIDPSSRELLDRLVERVVSWPILLLVMFRPEFQPPWTGQPHVTMLTLTRLDRRATTGMIANLAGEAVLSAEITDEIAERTDGVPLFIEELTRAVLESDLPAQTILSVVPHQGLSIPATLHASLIARLDRLGSTAKEIAQTGAAIGREFGYELLKFVTDLPAAQLRAALDRLVNAGLLFVRGMPPFSTYVFKHALVQDAAYSTLLRGRRQQLHRRITAILEEHFLDIVGTQPALLARHCAEAGLAEQAVAYWLKAGQQALAHSAMVEAVSQLRKGLSMLTVLPDSAVRQQQELDLQIALGPALTATNGWATASETFQRARALAEQLGRPEYLARLILGQWGFHLVRAEYRQALSESEQLESIGQTRADNAVRLLGGLAHGATRFYLGEFLTARSILERSLSLAGLEYRTIAGLSFDPYPAILTYLALTLACLGYVDQARVHMANALAEAQQSRHVHTLVHVLGFANRLEWIIGSSDVPTEELLTLTTKHGFRHYMGWALAFRGRFLMTIGQLNEGFELLTQGGAELQGSGSVANMAILLTWLAEAHIMLGRYAEALNHAAEAAQTVEATDERYLEAELLHRIPGNLRNIAGDISAAESHYRQAITVAEQQGAKLFQLRASTSLARLWCSQGKHAEARNLLEPICHWFSEGFDASDLKEAKALLNELA